MYNKCTMMGRIVNDLELQVTPNGTPVCTFRIAVERQYKSKNEERITDFFNIVAWRKKAEFVTKWFAKGRMILIDGEMQTRQYTDKNGNPATWYEIIADHITFTGEKKLDNFPSAAVPEPNHTDTSVPVDIPPEPAELPPEPMDYEDDYPF
ncbi:MAG: single-stranded DNA-binding protein [Oscillospiraceae bacterium]|nr:single-stranded DNA-binding protein [Oscillospiraceae bacterium]